MAELGETTDPRALVPGDPAAVHDTARALTAYTGDLREAGQGLGRLTSVEGWSGTAADGFRQRFAPQPRQWLDAGDAFTAAARALDVHAETLAWAQRQAANAVAQWQDGDARTAQAQRFPAPGAPALDPGEAARASARATLDHARTALDAAGARAASVVRGACERAPQTFWGTVGEVGDAALDVGKETVNALASLGNATMHHPGDILTALGGTGLMALGVGGEVGGGVLDLTVAGIPPGVALNIASAGAIAGGATMVGAGAMSVAQSAAGEDRVSPLETGGSGPSGPTPAPAAQRPTVGDEQLDNIMSDLYRGVRSPTRTGDGTTADAVRHERATGQMVNKRFHTEKANNTVRALRHWLRRNPGASPEDRGVAQQEYDNLLDALGRTK